jgi:hypothetical protein
MGYLISGGTGYMKDAVQVNVQPKYLYVRGGYSGSSVYSGYEGFGTRVLADGATIESYACVASEINNSPTANIGRELFEAYDARVVLAGGDTEARNCTITELYNLKQ